MVDKHEYSFTHDEITCCSDCPMFYDYMYCELEDCDHEYEEYTWANDHCRPDFCKLHEYMQGGEQC